MKLSDFSTKTINQINSLTADEKRFIRGSLECIIEAGELKTSAPVENVESMILAQISVAKATNAWDKCPIESDQWDALQEAAKAASRKVDNLIA